MQQTGSIARVGNLTTRRVLLAAGMILAAGCALCANDTITVALESNFQLLVDQSALVSTEKLLLGVLAVTNDARCGKGEVCVWEGDAIK